MKNKIPILVLLTAFTIPQIVSASWWNPLTWFRENEVEFTAPVLEETKENTTPVVENTVSTPTKPEPEIIEKTVIKTVNVPVEKIVEKTVTVTDQSVVNENITLKNRIKELEVKSNQCLADLSKLQANMSQSETRKKEIAIEIKRIEDQIYTLNNFNYICTISSSGSSSCQNNVGEQERWSLVSQLEAKKSQLQFELSKL